jgi:hypothetical protein
MLNRLISIVLESFSVVFDHIGGELSWRIGVVAGSRVIPGSTWEPRCSISRGRRIILRCFGVAALV